MSSQENFPRGGKRPAKEDKTEESAPKKKKMKKSEVKDKVKARTKHIVTPAAMTKHKEVESLTFQTLREGLLVLGRVKEVEDYRAMVALPHGLLGTLPITAISAVYSRHLQNVADSNDIEDAPTLKQMFQVGDTVQCQVTSVKVAGNNKRLVELTTCPEVINKDLPLTALKTGCLVYGAIQSLEEHGCTMDIGLPGIKAFLTNSDQPEGSERNEGECVWCTVSQQSALEVMSGETRVIKVTDENVMGSVVSPHMVSSVDCLRPGMRVRATVEKVLKDGLYVRCVKYKGCVYKTHIPQGLTQYTPGQEVEGRVLFTHPVSKVISLSLLPGILDCLQSGQELFGGLSIGDFVEEAQVMFVDKTNAVFFKLDTCTALAPIQHLSDDKIKDVNQAFPRGSKHRCRVIGFQPVDDVLLVTLKESIMQQRIMSIKDLQPGDIVECTVEATHDSGVIVRISKGLTGLIPKMHVADVPLKHFAKKFTKGDKLKCRVLKVDVGLKKVFLTKKKSLVSSKDVAVTYDGLTRGALIEGFVIIVKDNGVVVGFCNNVKGWVPRHELSSVDIPHPETAFYPGQVVKCRVLSCQPEAHRLRLSLIIAGKASIGSKSEAMSDFEAGKLVSAVVKRKLKHSIEVEVQPSGVKASLPRAHLSDSPDNQVLLWQALEPGDTLDTIMLLKQTNLPVVTLKESFLSAAREGLIPQTIHDLEPGQLVPGVIRNHQSYGTFVELPGGLGGLAPRSLTMDRPVSDLSQVFACGQSVVVKVIEVKQDKGRFLCSLRMCDCYHDDPKVSVEMLETYLNERDNYLDAVLDTKAEGLCMGSVVTVRVKEKVKDGYICDTPFGMPAVVTHMHTGETELAAGTKVEGVVLHISVDPAASCLEVSTDRALVRALSRRQEKAATMDRARQGQTIKGVVALMKEDFVLVALKQHAAGSLALLPRRQHLNDVLALTTNNLAVGEEIRVFIQKSEGDRVLGVLASLVKDDQAHPRHDLQLGQVVSASIQSILPGQMNIKIGDVSGRVHVTEVLDEVTNGLYPFSKYAKEKEVKVKITGFRHFKSFKYLPISHPRIYRALPECTLKPSKLQAEGCPREHQAAFTRKYAAGDKVPVFVVKFENSKLWVNVGPTQRGVLSVFDLSRDLGLLQHTEKHFPAGHGFEATVLGVEEEGGLIHLSMTGHKEEVKKNKVVTAKVTSVSDKGLALRLPGDFRGMVPADTEVGDTWKHVSPGAFVRCLVLSSKVKDNCVLSMNLSHRSEKELKKIRKETKSQERKRPHSESSDGSRKGEDNSVERERQKSTESESSPRTRQKSESDREGAASHPVLSDSERGTSAEEAATTQCLNVASGFDWETNPEPPTEADPSSEEEEEEDDHDEDETGARQNKQQRGIVALTSGSDKAGSSGKDFSKLLASTPNDSRVWIEFMVDQLAQGRVDSARALANQALQTIAIEEEQEKLNVWIALLNLENLYGAPEDVQKTLQRALQITDPLKLYRRVAAMYTSSGNTQEAEHIHKTMLRRFKQDRHVWIDYSLFLYKNEQKDAARKLLQRALLSIDRKDHVTTITQFASQECKHGEAERGFTMFEKVLAEYPKRFDVMTVYTDMVVLKGDVDKARELFERSWTLKPSMRLFKKYLQFEEKHGTEETLARLQARMENEAL